MLLGAAAVALTACADAVNTHGNMPDPEAVSEILPGIHSRQDVLGLLGTPSTVSTFQDSRWYYIGAKSEKIAFFDRDILERRVVVVSFDDNGTVGEKRVYTLADGQEIEPVDRITPTEGREITVMQQLFGNLGRFSATPGN